MSAIRQVCFAAVVRAFVTGSWIARPAPPRGGGSGGGGAEGEGVESCFGFSPPTINYGRRSQQKRNGTASKTSVQILTGERAGLVAGFWAPLLDF